MVQLNTILYAAV